LHKNISFGFIELVDYEIIINLPQPIDFTPFTTPVIIKIHLIEVIDKSLD